MEKKSKKKLIGDPYRDYMTKYESKLMHAQIKAGYLTFYKTRMCDNCKKTTVKSKNYCCLECKIKIEGVEENEIYTEQMD